VIDALIKKGANIDFSGQGAVCEAGRLGHLDCMKILVEAGADV